MRITVTSGDGLGDFILRLPWLIALVASGARLQIVVRQPTAELADLAALDAEVVVLRQSPYSKQARQSRRPFRREFEAVRAFRPDHVFFGPSQPSFLEEQAMNDLAGLRIGGFRLRSGFWPGEGLEEPAALAARYDYCVDVEPGDSEPQRNAKAARFFLGDRTDDLPTFSFPGEFVASIRPRDRGYVVVNASYRAGDYFPGWGEENWIRELGPLAANSRLVFVGSEAESDSNARVFAGLPHARGHIDLTAKIPDIRSLCAVLAGGDAYVGKDCGVMHLAAALSKPVLAVFGGGHWPRFLPCGPRAVVLTARVPCRGCDWRCHLPEPACVRGLPQGCLADGWRQLQSMDRAETHILELEPNEPGLRALPSAGDYPARLHRERRMRLRREREEFVLSPWRSWVETARSFFRG